MPKNGATTIGITTLGHNPEGMWVAGSDVDHLITDQLLWLDARAAPHSPPISAWLELDGKPNHQVRRFHVTPASNAQKSVVMATASTSTNPVATAEATAVPGDFDRPLHVVCDANGAGRQRQSAE